MRHTAGCVFSHVDADVVMNFGYLPQDMVGKSVFDFYHPDDLPFLKDLYESVMSRCEMIGSVYRSKPYRFAVHNGDFAMIETEWQSFINPWSKRLEFIIGLHTVLQGPRNPDIFEKPKDGVVKHASDETSQEAQNIRKDILFLLNKEFHQRHSILLCETSSNNDDRESSETPPSYNQLNYNENIIRFFRSKPNTTVSNESGERTDAADDEIQNGTSAQPRTPRTFRKCLSPNQTSGASDSDSVGVLSSDSNLAESGPSDSDSLDCYKPQLLTESVLHRHNEDMEKIMRQRHRDNNRSHSNAERESKKAALLAHGVKRTGSISGRCENCKLPRHDVNDNHCSRTNGAASFTRMNRGGNQCVQNIFTDSKYISENVICCSSHTPSVTHLNRQRASSRTFNNFPATGMLPVYCMPHQAPNPVMPLPVHYIPGMLYNYNPALSSSPFVCPSIPIIPVPFSQPILPTVPACTQEMILPNPIPKFQGPASQATSVKAEPGSVLGSVKSASFVNKTMSQCSRIDLGHVSVGSPGSVLVSEHNSDTQETNNKENSLTANSDESSCFSSLSSSFFKTDTSGSESYNESSSKKVKKNISNDTLTKHKPCPIKKCNPPWVEDAAVSKDFTYCYQVPIKSLEDVLESDLKALESIEQPMLVSNQLDQLYVELKLRGLPPKLILEEMTTSSSSSGDEITPSRSKKMKKKKSYNSLMMLYDDDAPLPSTPN